ncbi:hypothetical protein PINS_up013835 [Pythium insidiosum]|nr:hypothetical protein PINS_up013835 [Pythium insidiosum]
MMTAHKQDAPRTSTLVAIVNSSQQFASPPVRSARITLVIELAVVLGTLILDLGDLWYKARWIGPDLSYSFVVWSLLDEQPTPLRRTTPHSTQASGWVSFLQACDNISAIGGAFFHQAIGRNCRVASHHVPTLVMSSSIRADTVAWAACKILRPDRRPTLCRTRLVQRVPTAYRFDERPRRVAHATRHVDDVEPLSDWDTRWDDTEDKWTLEPSSAGESEVLELLSVIAESTPIGRVVCVEGFAYEGPGRYATSIFGCGSPSAFRAAFAGVHAPELALFQQNKAWLTSDWLNVLGMEFLIRENCIELFRVEESLTSIGLLTVENRPHVNFSCFGLLYLTVLVVDVVLLLLSILNLMNVARHVVWPIVQLQVVSSPRMRSQALMTRRRSFFALADTRGVLTSSLLRSTPVAALTLFSQLVSWIVVLANAIIWTWTMYPLGRVQAYLSTLRIWVIVLIICNTFWNALVVIISERRAFAVTRQTRVATYEVMIVTAVVTYFRREQLFAIGGMKYVMDGQRVEDAEAFEGHIAFANTVPESLLDQQGTQRELLWLVYRPLVEIVAWSLLGCVVIAVVRLAGNRLRPRVSQIAPIPVSRLSENQLFERVEPSQLRQRRSPSGTALSSSVAATNTAIDYERLVVERVLDIPIRARSFIRSHQTMETASRPHLRSALLLDHGIVHFDGQLHPRIGFFEPIQTSRSSSPFQEPSKEEGRVLRGLR